MIAGDFWLNVYAEALNVGADLLTGTGLSRYVVLRNIVSAAEKDNEIEFDFVIIDLPPSFGALVRAAFYSSDYYIVPCTSDNFSVYCVGLIGSMVPSFVNDWRIGLDRFRSSNPHYKDFDHLGQPVFAGWVFNGFDTARRRRSQGAIARDEPLGEREMVQADATMHDRVVEAINDDLVSKLSQDIRSFEPVANRLPDNYRIGEIEDANVLIQNSLWLSVPIGQLSDHSQVANLQDRTQWAPNQREQIELIGGKFSELADIVQQVCI